jgi:hypothetical protein
VAVELRVVSIFELGMHRDDDWLGTEEVARELGMSQNWVRRQVREGRLPEWQWAVAGRKTLRYQWCDVEDFRRRYARRR